MTVARSVASPVARAVGAGVGGSAPVLINAITSWQKTVADGWGNGYFYVFPVATGDFSVYYELSDFDAANKREYIGISTGAVTTTTGFLLSWYTGDGNIRQGSTIKAGMTLAENDIIEIRRTGTTLAVYQNQVLRHTADAGPYASNYTFTRLSFDQETYNSTIAWDWDSLTTDVGGTATDGTWPVPY